MKTFFGIVVGYIVVAAITAPARQKKIVEVMESI